MAAFWNVHTGFYWPNLLSFRTCFSYLRWVDYLLFSVSDLLFKNWLRRTMHSFLSQIVNNLVPRVLSYPPYRARELETLLGVGHGFPRIWEITNKRFRGEGPESMRFVSTEWDRSVTQMKLCSSWCSWVDHERRKKCTKSFDGSESVTSCRISGCLSGILSFGTCRGNRRFAACAVKNNWVNN